MSIARIGLIGAGNMGTAVIRGWVAADPSMAQRISVVDAYAPAARKLSKSAGVGLARSAPELVERSDLVLVAVKPNDVEEALAGTGDLFAAGRILVSVAAGKTIAFLESLFPAGSVAVVRLMPNLAVAHGAGTIAFAAGGGVSARVQTEVIRLLAPLGAVVPLPEKLFAAATAIGGSGPGFMAMVAEAFIDAGVAGGLPRPAARDLTLSMLAGTSRLLGDGKLSPVDLRHNVTSPGGTTAAGLAELERYGVRAAITDAVQAAIARAEELS